MLMCGCRQIELHRLNLGNIVRRHNTIGIEVEAKGSTRVIYLTTDIYTHDRSSLLEEKPIFLEIELLILRIFSYGWLDIEESFSYKFEQGAFSYFETTV